MGSLGTVCNIDDPLACCDVSDTLLAGVNGSCELQCAATMTATPKCTAPCHQDADCAVYVSHDEYAVSYGDVVCSHIAGLGTAGSHRGAGACVYKDMSWVIGVSMTVVGMTLSNLGTQVSKVALNNHQEKVARGEAERKSAFCMPLYCIGLTGMIGGAILDFLALAFAAQSLLAPLAACTLIVNMCLAPFVAKEKPGKLELVATLTITTGAVVSVAFAAHETKTYSLEQMVPYFADQGYLTWVACTLVFGISGLVVLRDGKSELEAIHLLDSAPLLLRARDSNDEEGSDNDGRSGIVGGASSSATTTPVLEEAEEGAVGAATAPAAEESSPTYRFTAPLRRLPNVYAFYCGALAGLSSGNSLLFAKGAAEAIKTAMQSGDLARLLQPSALIMLGGIVVSVYIQLHFLNLGMRYYDVLLILPIQQAFIVVGSAMNGLLFFHEYADFSLVQAVAFPTGVLITSAGVLLLTHQYKATGSRTPRPTGSSSPAPMIADSSRGPPADTPEVGRHEEHKGLMVGKHRSSGDIRSAANA